MACAWQYSSERLFKGGSSSLHRRRAHCKLARHYALLADDSHQLAYHCACKCRTTSHSVAFPRHSGWSSVEMQPSAVRQGSGRRNGCWRGIAAALREPTPIWSLRLAGRLSRRLRRQLSKLAMCVGRKLSGSPWIRMTLLMRPEA